MSTIIAASLLQHGHASAPSQVLGAVLPAIGINAALCLAALLVALFLRQPAPVLA